MKKTVTLLLCMALTIPVLFTSCHLAEPQSTPTTAEADITTPAPENAEQTTPPKQDTEPEVPPQEGVQDPRTVYAEAKDALLLNELETAYELFLTISDYGDVSQYLARFAFHYTTKVEYTPHGVTVFYYKYDEYGKILSGVDLSSYGTQVSFEYRYNLDQKPTGYTTTYNNGKTEIGVYQYDQKGNLVYADLFGYVTLLEYDDRGNIIKSSHGDTVETYAYDEMGRMTQKEYVTANTYRTQTLFEYDDETHSVKKQFSAGYVGEPLRVDTVTVSTYNEGGYLTKREIEHADGSSYLYEFFYDENGNQIKEHYKASDKNEYLHLWQYDEYGNKTHHSYESTTAWTTPYQEAWEYEYDAIGNVIKKTYTDSRYEGQDVSTYRYDEWGNILKETHPGESDSPNDYREVLYAGYKLYYNPYPVYELPKEFFGK